MAPTRGMMKAVNVAAQAFVRQVSKVVGAEVFEDAITFFQAFDGMEAGFKERAELVLDLLTSPATSYVLVASPRRDTVAEARFFAEKLAEADIPIAALVVNRMHPHFTDELPEALRERARTLDGTDLGGQFRNLADFALIAQREEDHLSGLTEMVDPSPVIRVPFLQTDVHDLGGLAIVGDHLFERA
jgi:anion-transporting  ArsA/GET3 family ATPase